MIRRAIVCCLALWSTSALAQDESGAYLGGGLGQFDYSDDDAFFPLDDATLSYKLYGGYRFNETWAIEGSYGETDDLSGVIPIANGTFTLRSDYEFLGVRGIAHLKAFFAGIGFWEADWNQNVSFIYSTPPPMPGPFSNSVSRTDSGLSVILGGQWDLGRLGVRIELEAYDGLDGFDADVESYNLGLGIHYRF